MRHTVGKAVVVSIGSILFLGVVFCSSGIAAETGSGKIAKKTLPVLIAQNDTGQDSGDDLDFLDEGEEQPMIRVADPLRPINKAMFVFNDKVVLWVLEPAARGYRAVVPEIARKGIKNFFYNLGMPVRFVGCVMQGKGKAAAGEIGRFILNSTVGVLGLGNPAARDPDLNPDAEDLGQTFGRYGIGNGIYLVLPLMGPSTLRDSVGQVGDRFLDPLTYVDSQTAEYSIKAGEILNDTSFRIGEYESMKKAAIDPYSAFRDAYLQYRQEKVRK